jgi:ubiquinone/menaquinone biosynthesis C-methylase UbiE
MSAPTPTSFDDAAAYEDFMSGWSRMVGERFLDWLAPAPGERWADVGCGNGAFTELLVQRCAPASVVGVDPSAAQVTYARERLAAAPVTVQVGDAQALPWPEASVDAAVMALVIFFVPDAPRGVAEMARVVRPGGSVSAYAWDMTGGGFPYAALLDAMTTVGLEPQPLPSADASRLERLPQLWAEAGLVDVATTTITVQRRWPDFDSWWAVAQRGPRLAQPIARLAPEARATLVQQVKERLQLQADGSLVVEARAHAVRGRRPG